MPELGLVEERPGFAVPGSTSARLRGPVRRPAGSRKGEARIRRPRAAGPLIHRAPASNRRTGSVIAGAGSTGAELTRLPASKTGAKTVPLGAPALRALAELPRQEGSPYVLPAERGDGHFVGIQKPWQRIRGAAGLDDVRIHDLRHSFASIAVSGGDSLYVVGKVLGHRQSRTTERYAHLKDDPLRAVAIRLRVSRGDDALSTKSSGGGLNPISVPFSGASL